MTFIYSGLFLDSRTYQTPISRDTFVRGRVLGVVGETGVYFQISGKCSGGFSPICIYILTSGIGNGWSSGFETSLTSSISAIYLLSVGFLFSVGILLPEKCLRHDLTVRVSWWPWWRPVLHQDGSQRASDQFPGALGQNPTRQTDQGDLRYGWNRIPCQLSAYSPNIYFTDLGKMCRVYRSKDLINFPQLWEANLDTDSYV